ncbi:dethiobiotin synthase, partial [Eubacteriales bacterium DFI.9.88]|nr:dethiobiotin synthase [Eubacteriales bacterium DFI.9.88]
MTKGLFITASGTDAGKTYLTGLMIKKMRVSGYTAGFY